MQFEDYDFPLLGYVQIPRFGLSKEEKETLGVPENVSSNDFLAILAKKGFEAKIQSGKIPKDKILEYHDRLDTEIAEICRLCFADYIILVYHVMKFCKQEKILNNYGRGCLVGETLVKTKTGYKRLKDIQIGDQVFTSGSSYELATNKFEYPVNEELVKINTHLPTHYSEIMTKDHKVLVLRNPFINKKRSNTENYIIGLQKFNLSDLFKFEKCEWVAANEVNENDYVVRNIYNFYDPNTSISRIDLAQWADSFDDDSVSEIKRYNHISKTYLCSKTLGKKLEIDAGALRRMKKGEQSKHSQKYIAKINDYLSQFNQNIDDFLNYKSSRTLSYKRFIKLDQDFCYLIGFFIGDGWIKTRDAEIGFAFNSEVDKDRLEKIISIIESIGFSYSIRVSKTKKLTQLIVSSRIFKAFFCSIFRGMETADIKEIPGIFLNQSKENLGALLHGLIDSDGYREKTKTRIHYDTTSEKLGYQVRDLVESLGYIAYILKREPHNNCSAAYKVTFSKPTNSSKYFHDGHRVFTKVKNKEIISGVDKVYDITVNNFSNYQTGNYIVHNSAAGSLLLYCLECTFIDPLYHNLLFERFISSARTNVKEISGKTYISSGSLPDVDIDSDCEKKGRINEYIQKCFPNQTAAISTFGTLQGKIILKECLKIIEEATEDQAKVAASNIEVVFGKVESLQHALKENPAFSEWAVGHEKTVKVASKLSGLIKNRSTHASGILICDSKLDDTIPMELSPDKEPVTSYDMNDSQMFGVKLDNLGLKNLTVLDYCFQYTGLKMSDIPVEDPSIYEFLNTSDDYHGIFQAEDGLGKKVMKQLKCQNTKDLSMSVALGRPGCMSFLEEVVNAKSTGKIRELDPRIDHILRPTFGVILFQESIMALSKVMAGFTALEANDLRKGIGKKLKDKVALWKDKFINESIKNNYKKEFVEEMWKTFNASGDYLFCAAHGAAYGTLSATTAYMKANHTAAFFTALLRNVKNEQDPTQEIAIINSELAHFGLKFRGPNLIKSSLDFSYTDNEIFFGLSSISGLGSKTLERLQGFRQNFTNKFSIFSEAKSSGISLGVLGSLIYSGCLDDFLTETRSKTVLEACLWNILTEKEKIECLKRGEEFGYHLMPLIKALNTTIKTEKGKPVIKDSRRDTLRKKMADYLEIYKNNSKHEDFTVFEMESRLLGFSYSQTLQNVYKKLEPNLEEIEVVKSYGPKENVIFVGKVKFAAEGLTKKAGMPYFRCVVADHTAEITCFLYENDRYPGISQHKELNGRLAAEGDVVVVRGQRSGDDIVNANNIAVQEVKVFAKASELPEKPEETENKEQNAP